MTDASRTRSAPWNDLLVIALVAATAFLLADDLAAGRLTRAIVAIAVIAGWAVVWYRSRRRETGPSILDRLDRIAAALERTPVIASVETATTIVLTPATSRGISADDLLDELKVAQEVSDPGRVFEIRDQLTAVLDDDRLKALDSQLAKWFMALIMKRLRTGSVQPGVAELVARVADQFGRTTEGASLRASLPTLRRSAGLCARCARPYRGIADACPICMAPPPPSEELPPPEDEADALPPSDEPAFVDPLDPL